MPHQVLKQEAPHNASPRLHADVLDGRYPRCQRQRHGPACQQSCQAGLGLAGIQPAVCQPQPQLVHCCQSHTHVDHGRRVGLLQPHLQHGTGGEWLVLCWQQIKSLLGALSVVVGCRLLVVPDTLAGA